MKKEAKEAKEAIKTKNRCRKNSCHKKQGKQTDWWNKNRKYNLDLNIKKMMMKKKNKEKKIVFS